jgi:hypothetical protein
MRHIRPVDGVLSHRLRIAVHQLDTRNVCAAIRQLHNVDRRTGTVTHHRQSRLPTGDEVIMPGRGHLKVVDSR